MSDFTAERKTLRRAATLIRRLDKFCDGKLEEDGIPARVIAGDLLELANDVTMFEAMGRVRGIAEAERHSVRVDADSEGRDVKARTLRVLDGGGA